MPQSARIGDDMHRYARLIRAALSRAAPVPKTPPMQNPSAIQVECGIGYVRAMIESSSNESAAMESIAPVLDRSSSPLLSQVAVVDRAGHRRPVYRGLLIYSCLQTYALLSGKLPQDARWKDSLCRWCNLLETESARIEWPDAGPMPAAKGSAATESAWMALALHVAGINFHHDAWMHLAAGTFARLARSQAANRGPFLHATASDNPETHWYHELILLHAAASYAAHTGDPDVSAAVAQNAVFQQEETQPDHATTQPWGLFAFASNPATRPLADQLLHSAMVEETEVSLMLLADALYCIELSGSD